VCQHVAHRSTLLYLDLHSVAPSSSYIIDDIVLHSGKENWF
jgi:hypothetical protein